MEPRARAPSEGRGALDCQPRLGRSVCALGAEGRHRSPPALRTQETLWHRGLRFLYHLLVSPGTWTRVRRAHQFLNERMLSCSCERETAPLLQTPRCQQPLSRLFSTCGDVVKSGLSTEAFVGQLQGWERERDVGQSALALLPGAHTRTEMLTRVTYFRHLTYSQTHLL